jgi:cytoskeletal protein CcmA (bactofilin family)
MNGNYSIQANFQQIQYNLTIGVDPLGSGTVGNGTVSAATWSGTWLCGNQRIVATPAAGYTFTYWSGDTTTIADIYGNDTTIAMHGNYSIVANFYLTTPACNCFHYAAGTLGTTPPTFQNSGKVNGDVFVSGAAGLSNAFTLNGNLYVKGDATLQNAITVNGDVYVLGNLVASNSQQILGNVYATGTITLDNSAKIAKSAYAQGSIWLTNASQIQGNAHYQGTISMSGGSSVGGTSHEPWPPGVVLPPFPTFTPPNDAQIDGNATNYKNTAIGTGTTYFNPPNHNLTVSGTDTLGGTGHYSYIPGNLVIAKNAVVTLAGTIFVQGTITVNDSAQIKLGAGDPPSNPWAIVGNGSITINNKASVNGKVSGTYPTPLPVIMSVNGDITVSGGGGQDIGAILYAPRGTIDLQQKTTLYGSAVGKNVSISSLTTATIAPGLDSRTDLPSCGCGP